jgi:EmrB/QacA subfamily drug resistance transporter
MERVIPKVSSSKYRWRWWALAVIALSLLITVIDCSVLNVALPTIQIKLNATSSQLMWMVNAYTMVFGAFMLTTGSLGDRIGRAKLLKAGITVFGIASLGAFFTHNPNLLIVWRIIQGAGAALLVPATLAIITNLFPKEERAKAIGVWAGIQGIGIALGPIVGGLLVQNFNWNSIFLINVPVAAIALIAGWFLIPESRDNNPRKLDIMGNILALAGLAALLYGLVNGSSRGWTDPQVLGILIGAVTIITIFIIWEKRLSQPLIEIGFFRSSHFSAGILALIIMGLGLNGVNYVLTYYMQFVRGYSALGTGLRYLPLAIGLLLGAVSTEKAEKRFGTKMILALGFLGSTAMILLASQYTSVTSFWILGLEFFFLGLFLGFVMTAVTDAIMGSIPVAQAGIGSAMNSVFRILSGTIGVAVLGGIISSIYSTHLLKSASLIPGLPTALAQKASDSIGASLGVAGSGQISLDTANALVQSAKLSFMDGWQVMALVSGGLFAVGVILVLILIPSKAKTRESESKSSGVTIAEGGN